MAPFLVLVRGDADPIGIGGEDVGFGRADPDAPTGQHAAPRGTLARWAAAVTGRRVDRYRWVPARIVDGLVTGWHEADASHLLLLEAVAGVTLVDRAYEAALAGP